VLVPFTSFSEFDGTAKENVWFAADESRPLLCFAGIWTNWTSVRKIKEGMVTIDVYGFLTTDANDVVRPIHPKAMPVILTTEEERKVWKHAPCSDRWRTTRSRSSPAPPANSTAPHHLLTHSGGALRQVPLGNFAAARALSDTRRTLGGAMRDIRIYIDKLHSDAEACATICETTSNEAKRKVFTALADTYRKLASDLERIAAANLVLDEERDKHLLGLLGGATNSAESLAQIAKAAEQ